MSLRSKYKNKSMKVDALKKKVEEENNFMGYKFGSDTLEFEDGKTCKFRLFPAHDGGDFYRLRRRAWVTLINDEGEVVNRTVLNSKVHGGTEKDVIEEYLAYAKDKIKDPEKLSVLTHWKDGIRFDNQWISYAVKYDGKETEFGLLEFKKTVRDAINKELFVEDEDDPIEIDPFTDIDKGLPILVKYNKKPNKKKGEDYYNVTIGKKPKKISEEDLEKFDKAKPLQELYEDVYNVLEFEKALSGLEHFDTENEFDLFEDEEWLEIVEEVRNQYDGEEDEDEDEDDVEDDEENDDDLDEDEDSEEEEDDDEEEDDEEEELEEEDEDEDDEEEEEEPKKKVKKSSKKKAVPKKEAPKKGKLTIEEIKARLKNKK